MLFSMRACIIEMRNLGGSWKGATMLPMRAFFSTPLASISLSSASSEKTFSSR
ncbi:MAG: hypothetical protein BWX71_01815 [Deltaproteobacteria bacterium ADurb.Bin072]|nr:MAG: hypothetical protein BWX71_01815 [Deltaproteobacteria bacterium ADurb.Bin072]